eukprot:gene14350-16970_t
MSGEAAVDSLDESNEVDGSGETSQLRRRFRRMDSAFDQQLAGDSTAEATDGSQDEAGETETPAVEDLNTAEENGEEVVNEAVEAEDPGSTAKKPELKGTQTGSSKGNEDGGKAAGVGLVGVLARLLCLLGFAGFAALLLVPIEEPLVGGALYEAPSSVLDHFAKGQTIKVAGASGDTIPIFVRQDGDHNAAETLLLLHGAGTSSYLFRQ